jgi:hypothetical protein
MAASRSSINLYGDRVSKRVRSEQFHAIFVDRCPRHRELQDGQPVSTADMHLASVKDPKPAMNPNALAEVFRVNIISRRCDTTCGDIEALCNSFFELSGYLVGLGINVLSECEVHFVFRFLYRLSS